MIVCIPTTIEAAQSNVHRTSAGFAYLSGIQPQRRILTLAFSRRFPHLPVPITALVKRSPKTDFYTCQVESLEPREFFSLAARFFYIISSSIGNASPPSPARSFVTRFQAQYSFVFRRALPRSAFFHFTARCPTPPCASALPLWVPAAAEHPCAQSV